MSKKNKGNDVQVPKPTIEAENAEVMRKMMLAGPMQVFLNLRELLDEPIVISKKMIAAQGLSASQMVLAVPDETAVVVKGQIPYTVVTAEREPLIKGSPLSPEHKALLSRPSKDGCVWVLVLVEDCTGIFEEPVELSMASESSPKPEMKWNGPKGLN
jgi:hypothetical protein